MKKWFRQQLNSKLFRKVFFTTLIASVVPLAVMTFVFIESGLAATSSYELLSFRFVLIILVALFFAAVVAYYISQHIFSPISAFIKSATEIARGNFSHQVKVKSKDEIGKLARLFNYMTTELRRLDSMNLAKIIAERNKTQTIIKNIADGVIVTDPDANILLLNASAENWFGLQEGESLDKPLVEYINQPELLKLISDARKKNDKSVPSVEISVKVPGEWKARVFQARAAKVLQEDGEIIGIVTILRDITQQKEIDKMKTELVSMVAHELRSPLTSISGFSELLLDDDLTREQSGDYARTILKESNRLGDLINKFLDISRIESGRIQPKKTNLDVIESVQMVVGNNSHLAQRKGIDVEVHAPSRLDKVFADRGMLEQVFLNLFTNAIKYSPGKTRIDIVLKQNESHVIVEFHDQGFGIPRESLSKIFEKFYRVTDDEKVREITGSGLGLSLVKQIVEMHDGRIEVESEVSRGSIFSVHLPRISKNAVVYSQYEDSENIIR